MITASRAATGLALAALLAALGACAAGNATSSLTGPSTASASTAPAAATPAQPAPTATAAAPAQHLTSTEINEKCWMRTEKFKADNLDKRMKMVDQCVDEMTRAQGGA